MLYVMASPSLPESLAPLVQRGVSVDRHRDLDVAVADDLPDDVRRDAEVQEEALRRCAAGREGASSPRPGALRMAPQLRRRLSGSIRSSATTGGGPAGVSFQVRPVRLTVGRAAAHGVP